MMQLLADNSILHLTGDWGYIQLNGLYVGTLDFNLGDSGALDNIIDLCVRVG